MLARLRRDLVTRLTHFLHVARRRVEMRRALVWTVRGTAVAGAATVLLQLLARGSTAVSSGASVAGASVLGLAVLAGGWLWNRPSLDEVARLADRCLAGQERLSTALAFEHHDGPLVRRQRADADAWLATADATRVAPPGISGRAAGVALIPFVLVAVLAALPEGGVGQDGAGAEARAALRQAADELRAIAERAAAPQPGEDAQRRRALASDLLRAEEALREAPSIAAGVAALSRAQERLVAQGVPSGPGRRSAGAAAGATLSQAGPAAEAAAALAGIDGAGSDELRQLAASLPGLAPEDRSGLAAALGEAAAAAGSPEAAQQLRRAAERIAAGDDAEARSSLEAAARGLEDLAATRARVALESLAGSLPALSQAEQAELAAALERASAAAGDDPELAGTLSGAAAALAQGRLADATGQLAAAGKRTEGLPAESRLDGEIAEAANALQSVKGALLDRIDGCSVAGRGRSPSRAAPARRPAPTTAPTAASPPGAPSDLGGSARTCATPAGAELGLGVPGEGLPGKGEGDGQQGGQGKGGQGEGQGQGAGPGQDQGQGQGRDGQGRDGQGSGQGGQGGTGPGGSASGNRQGGGRQGAQGPLGRLPGLANERVYVPGISGTGRAQALPGAGTGTGAGAAGVPYETVYSQYREAALSQSDRQVLPEATRHLLQRYFQGGDE